MKEGLRFDDWEDRGPDFLGRAFDGDFVDIAEYLNVVNPSVIMEVGFGNSRLLRGLSMPWGGGVCYYGFDKTETFVRRAKEEFGVEGIYFEVMNIEDERSFLDSVRRLSPDVLILRYVVEHLLDWSGVLSCIDKETSIPALLISLHVSAGNGGSWSGVDEGSERAYTVNYISDKDIDRLLSSYELKIFKRYDGVTHIFRAYRRRSV